MEKYHFIGIKGAGMSALAQVLHDLGNEVQGSDIEKEVFTEHQLRDKGISILPFDEANIVEGYTYIAGNAFGDDHLEISAAREKGYPVIRYHEFLSQFMSQFTSIAVTGAHGKTSTTGLLSHVMNGDVDTTFLIGDGTGFGLEDSKYFTFESCEYKRHFLSYHPDYAIITNIDFDHPDYFRDLQDVIDAFTEMADQVKKAVIAYGGDSHTRKMSYNVPVYFYGIGEGYDISASNIEVLSKGTRFDVSVEGEHLDTFTIPMYGDHHVLNSLAVIAVGYLEDLDMENIKKAFMTFGGVKRRFSETFRNGMVIVDDYAHHPKEIHATLETARKKYNGREIVTVFQPHTFSRTEKFLNEFAEALSESDKAYIVDIFGSAREDAGALTSRDLVDLIPDAELLAEGDIEKLNSHDEAVIIFMGAGDIQKYEKRFTELLS
ncbi:UDP-N-acetylmuramate--L-alanine ligase [Salinicoccus roseus]|uniref:UDP-N-acetylmuramate--L-alanine ligase n=1 Tax=Salinicoccus roseus TaxID=45670 RepID=A0A0C2E3I4_9STAP|nr:UDP-N-acetylmuramate--L-alanine ligase [Salinicoccus roseus]KIH70002.1 UDP-N-acetylmuramate--alanine ligase [Salinicoccus roseus]MDB0581303.1 UDP-N-acetylmuramate--L-alanine ligase [Salinicoccus roseus]